MKTIPVLTGFIVTVILTISTMRLLAPNDNVREDEFLDAVNKLNENILDLHTKFGHIEHALEKVSTRTRTLEAEFQNYQVKQTVEEASNAEAGTVGGLPSYSEEEAMLLLPGAVTLPPRQIRPPDVPSLAEELAQAQANATTEQNRIYAEIKNRLEDPGYLQTLNLSELTQSEEVQSLPDGYQKMIYGIALEKYNAGEVPREIFYPNLPDELHWMVPTGGSS